uniref:PPM-type phosphatase domain-containing protein n=1 Tax=Tetradesmus obliquus TaxID=3088 RepID=A0A383W5L0_TETOB|eukprot:jgi/Sobl393_1/10848/SZX72937.1
MVTASPELAAHVPVQQRDAGALAAPAAAPTSLHSNGRDTAASWAEQPAAHPYSSSSNGADVATGNNIIPVTGAAAAATTKTSSSSDGSLSRSMQQHQEQQQQQQQQQHQQHTAAQSDCQPCSRVWLPHKQLWVPDTSGTAEASHNGSDNSIASTPTQLQRVFMAAAATRGRKAAMEDRHVLAALDPSRGVSQAQGAVGLQQQVSVGGVFDGHAGYATAAYAAQHIPHLLHEALSGRPNRAQGGPRVPGRGLLNPCSALAASFTWFDRWWADARCDPSLTEHGWDDSGSTAVVGLVSGQHLIVANAGDSIALLARGGSGQRLSVEHRLDNAAEAERVLEAGGRLVAFKPGAVPRVMGTSNQTRFKGSMVTRSLGDFAFKHPQALLSAEPHVTQQELAPSDRLVVLTSDGVTDVLPDDDMLGVAMRALEQTQNCTNSGSALAKAAAMAIMTAAMEAGSHDNITVVTMLLDWGGEYATD